MKYKNIDSQSVLRIDPGEEIVESIKNFCKAHGITFGTVQGIGTVKEIVIGIYDINNKRFQSDKFVGNFEIISLLGNITTKDSELYLHLHATFSDDKYRTFGGHLSSAVISGTAEIFVLSLNWRVNRRFDKDIGLNIIDL